MTNILKIYERYKIMPQLKTHQLRVAAVAKLILENFNGKADEQAVIVACLLHDMGNIIKFNLDLYPKFNEPEGTSYWKSVQKSFVKKYGDDEHEATYKIAEEVGVDEKVRRIIHSIGFSKSIINSKHQDFEVKIVAYADNRVGMDGIRSLEDRLKEGKIRFAKRHNLKKLEQDSFEDLSVASKLIESQIFAKCKIKPGYITDEKVFDLIKELKLHEILS